ncbi:SRPBCC family protein [Pontibacterium sp.]|uniref:SRPBCC family protein n=1 Tax=Pontibacterium sp. TaxID=2036026 RepID=UPI0035175805
MGKCYNSVEISAPIDDIWIAISNFHDMSWAPDVITSVTKVGDKGENEIGAKRILNDAFHETLIKFDSGKYTYSYSIDDGPGPVASDAVSNYIGVVKLSDKNGVCLVEWSSSFDSANEDEVSEFCNPIYQALLSALKDKFS